MRRNVNVFASAVVLFAGCGGSDGSGAAAEDVRHVFADLVISSNLPADVRVAAEGMGDKHGRVTPEASPTFTLDVGDYEVPADPDGPADPWTRRITLVQGRQNRLDFAFVE